MTRKKTSKSSPRAKASKPKASPASAARKVESTTSEAYRSMERMLRDATSLNYDQTLSTCKEQIEKIGAQMFHGYEDVALIGKENVEALVKSSQVLAKSSEQLGRAIAGFTQSSLEMSAQAGQAMLGVKTLRDLVEVQSEFARSSFDHWVAGASKISDMAVKVANEAIEPLNQRLNEAMEKAGKQIAA